MSADLPTRWQPASTIPELKPTSPADFERTSEPVLVARRLSNGTREQNVATYRVDPDEPTHGRWVTECSEGWTLSSVTHWRELDWPEDG